MNDVKIKIQVFGAKDQVIASGCGCSKKKSGGCSGCSDKKNSSGGCSGCSNKESSGCSSKNNSCGGCGSSESNIEGAKTVGDSFEELKDFFKASDVKNNVIIEFIELNNAESINNTESSYDLERVKSTIENGFEPPITVVDGIIRYYGGISQDYIYKDVKELLE